MKRILQMYIDSYAGLSREAWLLSLIMLVNRAGSMVLFFLTLYLTSKIGMSVAEAGQMLSLYGLGSMGGAFLGGWLTDRWGPMRVQRWSLLGSAVSLLVLGNMTEKLWIAVLLFVTAVIAESLRPANSTAMAQVCRPEHLARGYGLNRLAINLGVAIGPALGGFLARIDYQLLFVVDGITCFIAGVLLWWLLELKPRSSEVEETPLTVADRLPWHDRIYLWLLLLLLICGIVFSQLFNAWPIYLREAYQLTEDRIGLLMAMNAILVVVIEMPLLHRLQGLMPLRVIAVGAMLLLAGFGLIPFGAGFAFAAFTVFIWSMGEILQFPMIASYVASRANSRTRGKYMGLFTFAFSTAFVIGPLLGTWLYDHVGEDALWYLCLALAPFVGVGFLLINKADHKEKAERSAGQA